MLGGDVATDGVTVPKAPKKPHKTAPRSRLQATRRGWLWVIIIQWHLIKTVSKYNERNLFKKKHTHGSKHICISSPQLSFVVVVVAVEEAVTRSESHVDSDVSSGVTV